MKIETSKVTRLRLTELTNLDPVEVIADNIAEYKGKVTITCYGQSWTAYWGSTGCDSVEEFFCSAGNDYLIGCLSPMLESRIADKDADSDFIKSKVIKSRRSGEITKNEASSLWYGADSTDRESLLFGFPKDVYEFMGQEPWNIDWPMIPNHDYIYLSRICDAVKAAFNEVKGQPHD